MNDSNTYRLENLLVQYERYVVAKSSSTRPSEAKQAIETCLANVIAVGANDFSSLQCKSLLLFKSKISIIDRENRIIKIIAHLEPVLILIGNIKEAPSEVKTLVKVFDNISKICSLPESKKLAIGSYVIDRLIQVPLQVTLAEYPNLHHFTQILAVYLDEPFVKNYQSALYDKLILLRDKAIRAPYHLFAKRFCDLSITLIKKLEDTPQDVINLKGYHGVAFKMAISTFHQMLKYNPYTPIKIDELVQVYCDYALPAPGRYLIRNSTSRIPQTNIDNGTSYYPFTISYSDYHNIKHISVTRCEKEGVISWCSILNDKGVKSYKSLEDFIQAHIPGLQPVAAIHLLKVSDLFSNRFLRLVNNNG